MSEVGETGGVLRRALAACRRHFVNAAVFSALVNLLYIAPTLYMLQIYDRVVPTQGRLTLLFLTLATVFALGTLAFLDRARARLLVRAGARLDALIVPALLRHSLRARHAPATQQVLRDFDAVRQFLTGPATLALMDAPWTPIYVLVCFLVHPWIGAMALAGALILPLLAWGSERATREPLERAQAVASESYAEQAAVLRNADTVRALGMGSALVERQLQRRGSATVAQAGAGLASGNYLALTRFVRLALQSLALGLGALLALNEQISAGAIFAASFLIARGLAPIEQVIGSWRSVVLARESYGRLRTLLDGAAIAVEPTQLPPPRGEIALEGATKLAMPSGRPLLIDLNAVMPAGEVVAIVGPSGAGKSTLARLIAGATSPDRGRVRFDGADAADWAPERLARHIGYLPQDVALLSGSIKDNICRFATATGEDQAAIDAAVIRAAQRAGVHELILRLPGGYDYRIGIDGEGVSAGQAQRLALARALYGDPAILILDEPNSHLDGEGEAQLAAVVKQAKAERKTVLMVTHKLSIMPLVDRILVLRDGRIVEFGPRDQIIAQLLPAARAPGGPPAVTATRAPAP